MIKNGRNTKLGTYNLPDMSQTITSWFQPLTVGIITRIVVDFEQIEQIEYVDTEGVVQPYKPEPLEIQQAGVQTWVWQQIHCLPNLILRTNDVIEYLGKRYKVLFKNDYRCYGYLEYMLCETFGESK
jgi:hypothetical protein